MLYFRQQVEHLPKRDTVREKLRPKASACTNEEGDVWAVCSTRAKGITLAWEQVIVQQLIGCVNDLCLIGRRVQVCQNIERTISLHQRPQPKSFFVTTALSSSKQCGTRNLGVGVCLCRKGLPFIPQRPQRDGNAGSFYHIHCPCTRANGPVRQSNGLKSKSVVPLQQLVAIHD